MSVVWTNAGTYRLAEYGSEDDLETSILQLQDTLFGPMRIYLDVKRLIGKKGGVRNIPDGYLIDLTGAPPRLYVVENELAEHDVLRHIAVQILQFSLSFRADPWTVKRVLLEALQARPDAQRLCDEYIRSHDFRNLDHLLEHVVREEEFRALVIIDSLPEKLETVLAESFSFGVEVLELPRFQNKTGEFSYQFEPFLADLRPEETGAGNGNTAATRKDQVSPTEIDTVVVPAREEGFQRVFIGENRWHAVRLHGSMRPQIKYAAVYQIAPEQAITYLAPVRSIEPWEESGKFVINFAEPAKAITPVRMLDGGHVKNFQGLRYTSRARLLAAKSLDDLW